MAINNLPPQAYTRETVAEAFEWMKSQSPATRDLAKDANTLVSLYLNAKRHKRIKNMQPEDTAEFQNELKNLARGIQQFNNDSTKNSATEPTTTASPKASPAPQNNSSTQIPVVNTSLPLSPSEAIFTSPLPPTSQATTPYINPQEVLQAHARATAPNPPPRLKPATQHIINQTKAALHLDSDQEVMNVLIALGFEHIKTIFKI